MPGEERLGGRVCLDWWNEKWNVGNFFPFFENSQVKFHSLLCISWSTILLYCQDFRIRNDGVTQITAAHFEIVSIWLYCKLNMFSNGLRPSRTEQYQTLSLEQSYHYSRWRTHRADSLTRTSKIWLCLTQITSSKIERSIGFDWLVCFLSDKRLEFSSIGFDLLCHAKWTRKYYNKIWRTVVRERYPQSIYRVRWPSSGW